MDGSAVTIHTEETDIFVRSLGSGPPVLLLHGFPETHLMWRHVAPRLAQHFTVVCADLRGYGNSGCPPSDESHAPYSKRTMAADMMKVMKHLSFDRFSVVGHDRGGRVAYRMALDYPGQVAKLAVLDIVPTSAAWNLADSRLALAFWPWSLLAQPEPLPERLLSAAPEAVIDDAISQWDSSPSVFPPDIQKTYAEVLRQPDHIHAICEEYRAAATVDRHHDEADAAAKHRIACPVLALWAAGGALDTWYVKESGPLALWREWGDNIEGSAVQGGHFFPEENPDETARHLLDFLQ